MTRGHVNLLELTAEGWELDEFLAVLVEDEPAPHETGGTEPAPSPLAA